MKYRLKVALGYNLKDAAEHLKMVFTVEEDLITAEQVNVFLAILKFEWDYLFQKSLNVMDGKRFEKSRCPISLPDHEDLIRQYMDRKIKEMSESLNEDYDFWDT